MGRPQAFGIRRQLIRLALFTGLLLPGSPVYGQALALEEAIELAARHSDRSRIIEGDLEVAEKRYSAQRINFLVPEISINGSVPAYQENESYRFYGGLPRKTTIKTTDLDLISNIQLTQHLITGGEITARANLWQNSNEYPEWNDLDVVIDQRTRQGYYEFELRQPLLGPSEAKHTLENLHDDLEIARLVKRQETATLTIEVIDAYFGLLQTEVRMRIAQDRQEATRLKAAADSAKLADGIITAEIWMESVSAYLDAELGLFDVQNQRAEKSRQLAAILDLERAERLEVSIPEPPPRLEEDERGVLSKLWQESADIQIAGYEYQSEHRAARHEERSHGLSGELLASYAMGRGTVVTPGQDDDEIKTSSWELSLRFTFPLWDGGASKAAVQAARLRAERARLEWETRQRTAQDAIADVFNRLQGSHQRIDLLRNQVDFAVHRLEIAQLRRDNGEISEIQFLERRIERLEADDAYLEELRNCYITRQELVSRWGAEALSGSGA